MPPDRRPPLDELLGAAGVDSVESLLLGDQRPTDRMVAIPVDVEPGADRASFATAHPEAEDIWLYLVDPGGDVADPLAGDVHHVGSGSLHEFVVVDRLLPGRWLLVAVRVRPGGAA